jgi:hypothetical protein
MANLLRLFKKFPAAPLPDFERMDIADLPGASALLFYGGNKLTELFGGRVYHHPYTPPAFHASLYLGAGDHLNVGKFRAVQPVQDEFRSTRRVDAIIYDMTPGQRLAIIEAGRKDTTKPKVGLQLPDYGWQEYLRFGLPWFRPTHKDMCAENVCENMALGAVRVTYYAYSATAPWSLLEYALDYPRACRVVTLHVGKDFKR